VRGALGYTGRVGAHRVSVQSTGMGMPSCAIYVHELLAGYGARVLIRIGTCGAIQPDLELGDVVLAMDGVPIPPAGVDDAVARVRAAAGREMTLTGVRGPDATPFTVRVVPSPALDGSGGRIGVQLATRGVVTHRVAKGPAAIVRTAAAEYARLGGAVLAGLKGLVTNFGDAASRLAGPVAIVAAGAEVARADGAGLFQFAAIVNINLAVVNLLPLPALDGGYLALLAVEAVRGGVKLPKEVEQTIMASGLLLLMAAGAVLLVRDTLTLSGLAGG
jgi:RIP metalloprotease RseP